MPRCTANDRDQARAPVESVKPPRDELSGRHCTERAPHASSERPLQAILSSDTFAEVPQHRYTRHCPPALSCGFNLLIQIDCGRLQQAPQTLHEGRLTCRLELTMRQNLGRRSHLSVISDSCRSLNGPPRTARRFLPSTRPFVIANV